MHSSAARRRVCWPVSTRAARSTRARPWQATRAPRRLLIAVRGRHSPVNVCAGSSTRAEPLSAARTTRQIWPRSGSPPSAARSPAPTNAAPLRAPSASRQPRLHPSRSPPRSPSAGHVFSSSAQVCPPISTSSSERRTATFRPAPSAIAPCERGCRFVPNFPIRAGTRLKAAWQAERAGARASDRFAFGGAL